MAVETPYSTYEIVGRIKRVSVAIRHFCFLFFSGFFNRLWTVFQRFSFTMTLCLKGAIVAFCYSIFSLSA